MKSRFCLECGTPLNQQSQTKYVCKNGHSYWNNPRAAVSVLCIKEDQMLVAKRDVEPRKGKYDFPGGFLEFNEDPTTAAKRELSEETGLIVKGEIVLIAAYTHQYFKNTSVVDLIYIARKWSGIPMADDDVAELAWKDLDFIDSNEFSWQYPGLAAKLKQIL